MRPIVTFIMIFLTALFMACSDNGTGSDNISDPIMPLKIGNAWYGTSAYITADGDTSTSFTGSTIADTIYVNGECWYLTAGLIGTARLGMADDDPRPSLVFMFSNRADGLWMWEMRDDTLSGDPAMYAKHPVKDGETYSVGGNYVEVSSPELINIASLGDISCYVHHWYSEMTDSVEVHMWWAAGIGYLRSESIMYSEKYIYQLDSVNFR